MKIKLSSVAIARLKAIKNIPRIPEYSSIYKFLEFGNTDIILSLGILNCIDVTVGQMYQECLFLKDVSNLLVWGKGVSKLSDSNAQTVLEEMTRREHLMTLLDDSWKDILNIIVLASRYELIESTIITSVELEQLFLISNCKKSVIITTNNDRWLVGKIMAADNTEVTFEYLDVGFGTEKINLKDIKTIEY